MEHTGGERPRSGPPASRRRRRTALRALEVASDWACRPLLARAAHRLAPALGVPPHFVYLLLAVEDKRFLWHRGVDPVAVARATVHRLLGRRGLEGASTITQQLYQVQREARGLPRSRTVPAKWQQVWWAIRYQARRPKAAVLGEYLAGVYFGRGAYGLDAALRRFGLGPRSELGLAESFFLVERLASPNVLRPGRVAALLRRAAVAPLFQQHPRARAELLALYERHFGTGAAARIRAAVDEGT
jgi:membrane peptidoglycan carboxypeptidase